ncbi:GntR family transcriptional regulator [Micromonospora sp. LHW51205]|uniref:GntR family transcriptional regulator n=1 Tax=Micromonospora sp. LHW51205 TaxID=2248752 RepID=UPI001314E91C|nr:GntR family transcriptional regulator [Micromonospora sp. LHW51205]
MPTPHYGQPRYRAIASELRERIASGLMAAGSLLPPESTLTAEFRVSRGTVRHAIALLREEGVVATEHGRGTYVIGSSRTGSDHQGTTRRRVPADARLAGLLGVEVGTPLVECETVKSSQDRPKSVTRTYQLISEGEAW